MLESKEILNSSCLAAKHHQALLQPAPGVPLISVGQGYHSQRLGFCFVLVLKSLGTHALIRSSKLSRGVQHSSLKPQAQPRPLCVRLRVNYLTVQLVKNSTPATPFPAFDC